LERHCANAGPELLTGDEVTLWVPLVPLTFMLPQSA
jgi:hypothetical protein